ncbi:MAG TPA: hypothetical protein VG246_12930 [Acidimicrobiales bacterium]|jgi:uncharacterized protein with PQ loop repeat|nr:hypothetical protein [Acidimicrobiales bacterium]
MSFGEVADAIGWVALLLGFGSTVAQFDRVRRLGIEGVSIATWTLFFLMSCFWVCYGVAVHSFVVVLSSVILMPFQVSIVHRLHPRRAAAIVARSFAYAFLLCALTTYLWGWSGGLLGTGLLMIINRGPQIIELVRSRTGSGVSVASWSVGAICLVCWVVYYAGLRQWAAAVSTGVATLASGSIALLATWRHHQVHETIEVGNAQLAQA